MKILADLILKEKQISQDVIHLDDSGTTGSRILQTMSVKMLNNLYK